jgi:uncharacterized protein
MFGLPSLSKLVVLIGIITAVWYGFKLIGRLDAARKAEARRQEKRRVGGGKGRSKRAARRPAERTVDAEDMVQCPACDAYVAAKGARNCGRPDCPY